METLTLNPTLSTTGTNKIIYRELTSENDFEQCVNLQKSIFNLPDTHLVSPLFLNLYARNDPPAGVAVGVFNITNTTTLIGFIIGTATFLENTTYIVMLGIKPEYKNKIYGYRLLMEFKEIALKKNINHALAVYEPLDTNLARLYINYERFAGIKYIEDHKNKDSSVPSDKLLMKWNFKSSESKKAVDFNEAIANYPIITPKYNPESDRVLLELPHNFSQLKIEDLNKAMDSRYSTREMIKKYLNLRNYEISNCITGHINNERKSYYLFEKNDLSSRHL